jgi:hypothetical protein
MSKPDANAVTAAGNKGEGCVLLAFPGVEEWALGSNRTLVASCRHWNRCNNWDAAYPRWEFSNGQRNGSSGARSSPRAVLHGRDLRDERAVQRIRKCNSLQNGR